MNTNTIPKASIKSFFVETEFSLENLIKAINLLKTIWKIGQFLYKKIKSLLKKPKHHRVNARTVYWSFRTSKAKVTHIKPTSPLSHIE